MLLFYLVFPMVSSLAIRAFDCEEFDDGKRYLRAAYSLDCSSDEYQRVRSLAWLVVVCYPVTQYTAGACLQPWVVVGVALLFYSFECASALIVNLQNPFAATHDSFDADSTMCGSELSTYTLLRSGFREETPPPRSSRGAAATGVLLPELNEE